MATTQHYVWASGHFVLLLAAAMYMPAGLFFSNSKNKYYSVALLGALTSYAIVCFKSLGTPQPNLNYIRRALMDENVQYFILAFHWWSAKPVTLALVPYIIFSTFHALTFTRTTILPRVLPPGPPATQGGAPTPHPLARSLQSWVKANYDKAMRVVAFTEILIMARLVVGAIVRSNSLMSIILYAMFLRSRYYQSAFTREAFALANSKLDQLVTRDGVPPVAKNVLDQARFYIAKYAGGPYAAAAAPPQAAAAPRR
ncbi:hypothetical protein BD626DRAFT_459594 [Schizophyllum amplum]|uniref:Endoplasmic reticulum protein n=1 Tax=Schizophyllum amplum TaxID=97359 RepID=A0A550C9D0_9AGAR|nr:hypothetical protein BD626DRAFT_459594 [Auriculariopsis ampla]